ncbi:MAG: flagellar assembly protein FliW [Planctomycetes bacterium]|nr:flagellar assembly protein FliW [Planctomycetota bacterium]
MKVMSTRFGHIEVDQERLLKFPKGLLGFPENQEYALLQTNDEGNFFWLQSVDQPEVAFVVCDPLLCVPDYQVPIKPEDHELLKLESLEHVQTLVIVNKIDRNLTVNLQGPLVINALNRRGRQVVLSEKKFSTRHPMMDLDAVNKKVSKTA